MSTIGVVSISSKPEVGEIHTVRISMATLFGSESNFDSAPENRSESSIASSSSSSSKKSDDHPRPRRCIIWKTTPTIQVLVMARFGEANVADPNVCLFSHLTHEYVLKRLVAVSPKLAYGGRRSISAATKATNQPIKTVDTNVILIPVVVPKKWKCKTVQEYLPAEELHYMNELLRQISIEESDEQTKSIQAASYPKPPSAYNIDVSNQGDDESSSASSSLPKARLEFAEDIHWRKNDLVNEWLDHVQIGNADHPESLNNSLDDFLADNQPATVSSFDRI